jgi:hypothetical protein
MTNSSKIIKYFLGGILLIVAILSFTGTATIVDGTVSYIYDDELLFSILDTQFVESKISLEYPEVETIEIDNPYQESGQSSIRIYGAHGNIFAFSIQESRNDIIFARVMKSGINDASNVKIGDSVDRLNRLLDSKLSHDVREVFLVQEEGIGELIIMFDQEGISYIEYREEYTGLINDIPKKYFSK